MVQFLISVENPFQCRIIRRLNRFAVEVEVGGNGAHAHINNSGRLTEYMAAGTTGYCLRYTHPKKTQYRLFAIRWGERGVLIDTRFQMAAFEEALCRDLIPWLSGFRCIRRDSRLGDSRIDYLLRRGDEECFLEVKSAALRLDGFASYPDCPSLRGQKHIRDLIDAKRKGKSAGILFIATVPDSVGFVPNLAADPAIHALLVRAAVSGVALRAIALCYFPEDSQIGLLDPDLPVCLEIPVNVS
jgi:sugar fermentation stimulation protein A